ncbi:MAG: alpha-N-arabinofuranosidase [Prolixibacteraceae bacterium]|nr:alpha-N-arabinofuranosidase [Prolixibacteraceae bacterium]MBN2774378.1 alpha-N-arabinofuranosidase [Prolixibacteraceae bacterium]
MKNLRLVLLSVLFTLIGISLNAQVKISLDNKHSSQKISKHIYGHFSEHLGNCIYGGIWVGEDSPIPNINGIRSDVADALIEVGMPSLRWPGGCFADEYHWKDGIGPKSERPPMINTHWGMVSEDNSFGTHEFLELCELLDCEPIFAGNMGSGTVREMSEWVEYVNADIKSPMTLLREKNGHPDPWYVKYWNIGNESWGCGGNMSAEDYFNNMVRYSTFLRSYPDKSLYKIIVGPGGSDPGWTEKLLKLASENRKMNMFNAISMHYYTVPGGWAKKGSATDFSEKEWIVTIHKALGIEDEIEKNIEIFKKYSPRQKIDIAVDEWGCWHDQEPGSKNGFLYQQNTLRDAMVAALSLNIFNNHCDWIKMANIAQTINVLQAMILTNDEEIVKTPTYYVFKMYKLHQDAILIPTEFESPEYKFEGESVPAINISASKNEKGEVHFTLANFDPLNSHQIEIPVGDDLNFSYGEILTAENMNDFNDFGENEKVITKEFKKASVNKGTLLFEIPAKSILMLEVK